MQAIDIDELIQKYIKAEATALEQSLVETWYQEQISPGMQWSEVLPQTPEQIKEKLWQSLLAYTTQKESLQANKEQTTALDPANSALEGENLPPRPEIAPIVPGITGPNSRRYSKVLRWAIAALIILAIGAGLYKWQQAASISKSNSQNLTVADIPPGSLGALLTLADGTVIQLDSLHSTQNKGQLPAGQSSLPLPVQGQSSLRYEAKGLKYTSLSNGASSDDTHPSPIGSISSKPISNRLTTPLGRQFQVTLSDGTEIWLNAGSSITYPAAFTGATRQVQLSGEAYFEVAKDPAHPFIVLTANAQIKVLGTHFNVKNYPEEPAIKTTLLEGAVQVENAGMHKVIAPGQQATIVRNSNGIDISTVDTEGAVAWKNGYFHFEHSDIKTFMRQVARWYNLEVHFESNLAQRYFGGEIERSQPLSSVLNYLRRSGVKLRAEGRVITILKD